MSYAACDDVGASAVATQVVVGLGATVVLEVVVGAAVVVVATVVVVAAVVVVAGVVAVVVAVVATWVVVTAAVGVFSVLDADGEPPHAPRTDASATRVRSALGRIER
jgi:hypothetical protein